MTKRILFQSIQNFRVITVGRRDRSTASEPKWSLVSGYFLEPRSYLYVDSTGSGATGRSQLVDKCVVGKNAVATERRYDSRRYQLKRALNQ